jgi:hypothetical protein
MKKLIKDESVYIHRQNDKVTIISIHVDDLFICTNDADFMKILDARLEEQFTMKNLGKLQLYLGIHVVEGSQGVVKIHQKVYYEKLIKLFRMSDAHPKLTPDLKGFDLDSDIPITRDEEIEMEAIPFKNVVGSLMYNATRPDLAHATNKLSRYFCKPRLCHWQAAKYALRYLKGTLDMGLTFDPKKNAELIAYVDANWGGVRSITGYLTMLAGAAVSWKSVLQKTPAQSTVESEYLALAEVVKEVVHGRDLMGELGFPQKKPTKIFIDNRGARLLALNNISHGTCKHISIRAHLVRYHVEEGHIELVQVPSAMNLADMLTKPMDHKTFRRLRDWVMNVTGNSNMSMESVQAAIYSIADRMAIPLDKKALKKVMAAFNNQQDN